jgi:hypothetical protein
MSDSWLEGITVLTVGYPFTIDGVYAVNPAPIDEGICPPGYVEWLPKDHPYRLAWVKHLRERIQWT